jgi:hypothetical protein
VQIVLGWLALAAAFTVQAPADSTGALAAIFRQPFGAALLAVVAAGLLAYALWQVVYALVDPDRVGGSARALGRRAAWTLAGMAHAGLGAIALGMLLGLRGDPTGDARARDWTAWLLGQPFGRWLVILLGVAIVGGALWRLRRALGGRVDADVALWRAGREARGIAVGVARFGLGAQAVALGLVGAFLVVAGVRARAAEARGLAGALAALERQPYGDWLLALVGAGFVAAGAFELLRAWRRRFDEPPE